MYPPIYILTTALCCSVNAECVHNQLISHRSTVLYSTEGEYLGFIYITFHPTSVATIGPTHILFQLLDGSKIRTLRAHARFSFITLTSSVANFKEQPNSAFFYFLTYPESQTRMENRWWIFCHAFVLEAARGDRLVMSGHKDLIWSKQQYGHSETNLTLLWS